jgi:hypothetical protein
MIRNIHEGNDGQNEKAEHKLQLLDRAISDQVNIIIGSCEDAEEKTKPLPLETVTQLVEGVIGLFQRKLDLLVGLENSDAADRVAVKMAEAEEIIEDLGIKGVTSEVVAAIKALAE